MNNNLSIRNSRDIVPSARKSIHSHGHCPFDASQNMGRYSLTTLRTRGERPKSSKPTERDGAVEQGADELDNIMSKLRADNEYQGQQVGHCVRRNSFDINYTQEDFSDDVVLAKSLPTSLPSYSLCSSQEWDQDDVQNKLENTVNTSSQSENFETPENSRYPSNSARNQTPKPQFHSQSQERSKINKTSTKSVLWAPFVVVFFGIIATYSNQILGTKQITIYDESRFYNDMNNLGGKYRLSRESLLQVQAGISTIYEKEDTGSFIFVYNSKLQYFNNQLFDDVLDNISHTAAKFLRNDSTTVRHLVVESSDLNMQTTKELILRYQDDVTKTGVMLVKEIDRIPSSLAMAFHYYCDEYNPLVKKSAIFFTLDLARCHNIPESSSIHALIEKCLTNKWSSVPSENIKPLLSRVVSVVVDLTHL